MCYLKIINIFFLIICILKQIDQGTQKKKKKKKNGIEILADQAVFKF